MIRILIVDDQNLVQQGIKSLLDRDMDFKVIGSVTDGRNAVQQIAKIHPDIVLLDIEMPGMNGITTTKYINRVSPKTKVIILSSHEDKKYVTQALMAGAKGYILKSSLMTDLKQAIVSVNNGYSQIDSRLLAKVFDPQNIRIKKSKLNSEETNLSEEDDHLKSSELLSNNDENQKITEDEAVDNTANPLATSNSSNLTSSLKSPGNDEELELETAAQVADSDSTPETIKSTSNSMTPETVPERWVPSKKTFAQRISDSVVLKQVDSDTNSEDSHDYPRKPVTVFHQTALAPVKQKSPTEQYRLANSPNKSQKSQKKAAAINHYWDKVLAHPKISIHKPKIEQLQTRLNQYKTKIVSFFETKSRQNILWNIGLVILGIIFAVALSKL